MQLVVKPLFFDHLSFTSKISYLPNVIRSEARNYLFSLGLDYALIDTPTERLSLKATYFDGGLDLTKQPANVFVLGMGAAF